MNTIDFNDLSDLDTVVAGHVIGQRRGRHVVRANIWPAKDDDEYRANGSEHYFYGRAHDHNLDFLTVGYLGLGYVSDYYDYGDGADDRVVTGHRGEPVPLRFVESSALTEGRMLLHRAGIDMRWQERRARCRAAEAPRQWRLDPARRDPQVARDAPQPARRQPSRPPGDRLRRR